MMFSWLGVEQGESYQAYAMAESVMPRALVAPEAFGQAPSNITLTGLAAASTDTDKFLVSDSNVVKTRTGAQVLSDIGGASQGFAIAQAVALG